MRGDMDDSRAEPAEDTAEKALDDLLAGTWNHEEAKRTLEYVQQARDGMITDYEMVRKIALALRCDFYNMDGTVAISHAELAQQIRDQDNYNRDLALRARDGQVGSGMKHR